MHSALPEPTRLADLVGRKRIGARVNRREAIKMRRTLSAEVATEANVPLGVMRDVFHRHGRAIENRHVAVSAAQQIMQERQERRRALVV